jgi:hypothetical protein
MQVNTNRRIKLILCVVALGIILIIAGSIRPAQSLPTPLGSASLALPAPLPNSIQSMQVNQMPSGNIVKPNLSKLTLAFEPNAGQADQAYGFVAHQGRGTLFFSPAEVVLALAPRDDPRKGAEIGLIESGSKYPLPNDGQPSDSQPPAGELTPTRESAPSIAHFRLIGSNPEARVESGTPLKGKVNYMVGDDPANWHKDLSTYASITYTNIYSGVDVAYSGIGDQLRATYSFAPGADTSRVL